MTKEEFTKALLIDKLIEELQHSSKRMARDTNSYGYLQVTAGDGSQCVYGKSLYEDLQRSSNSPAEKDSHDLSTSAQPPKLPSIEEQQVATDTAPTYDELLDKMQKLDANIQAQVMEHVKQKQALLLQLFDTL